MHRSLTFYLIVLAATVLISACASKPIIDTQNVNMVQYQKDLEDCENVAEQVQSGQITAKSAAFGTGVGAAHGAIDGDIGNRAAHGAVTGAAGGLLKSDNEKARVTKNCLRYRGYRVLN
jgi:hypothetical protein